MLKRALLGATALALLAGSASAADLATRYPVKAAPIPVQVFSWTGFYIGGNVGWGWADNSYDYTPFGLPTFSYGLGSSNGFVGGGQLGYNYQFANNVVLGVEADFDWADIGKTATLVGGPVGGAIVNSNVDYFGTIRARAGYAIDRFLPYITGGAAWANSSTTIPGMWDSKSSTNWGWTVGAGAEYAITNNWTVKAEYLYLSFDGKNYTLANADTLSTGFDLQTVKLGVNYKF